jgi:hypothetical protein
MENSTVQSLANSIKKCLKETLGKKPEDKKKNVWKKIAKSSTAGVRG